MHPPSSGISRRIAASIQALQASDYEGCLVHYFPALDATAKRRRPKDRVGDRIRRFLDDEEAAIFLIAGGHRFFGNFVDGFCFSDAVYQYGRTSVMHEGVLDPRLSFDEVNGFQLGSHWKLNPSFIAALLVAAMMAPENERERYSSEVTFSIAGRLWRLEEIWGAREAVRIHLAQRFNLEGNFAWNALSEAERDDHRKLARRLSQHHDAA